MCVPDFCIRFFNMLKSKVYCYVSLLIERGVWWHHLTSQHPSAPRPRTLVYVVSNTHRLKPHSISHSKFITSTNLSKCCIQSSNLVGWISACLKGFGLFSWEGPGWSSTWCVGKEVDSTFVGCERFVYKFWFLLTSVEKYLKADGCFVVSVRFTYLFLLSFESSIRISIFLLFSVSESRFDLELSNSSSSYPDSRSPLIWRCCK
jgi:hypothetical protein